MIRKLGLSILTLVCGIAVWATPVTPEEAATAVSTWLGFKSHLGCRLGAAIAQARTCMPTNGVSFHVVKLAGGGFVVTSSDTEDEPILAFSDSDDLVESEENPLWVMLRRDLAARAASPRRRVLLNASSSSASSSSASSSSASSSSASSASSSRRGVLAASLATPSEKWARLLPLKSSSALLRTTQTSSGQTSLSDVRVAPLLETKWCQQDANNYGYGDPCFNYYTPNNYPCGCVATAGAQIMRYHKYPTSHVTPGTYLCQVEVGKDWVDAHSYYPIYEGRTLTMQGGYYDWDSMPAVPANGVTLAQRQAIGKLTSDIGIACLMDYAEGGSSAGDYMLARRLPETFGFASAIAAVNQAGLDATMLRKALISNLDAKLPVVVGLDGDAGGHAVVADGYGYSMTTLYVHINMGFSGLDDAWYAPPDIAEYTAVGSMVYNIYPEGTAGGVIASGRVLSPSGSPIAGATVSVSGKAAATTTSDANGIYAFILQPGSYTISSGDASQSVTLVANVGIRVTDDGYYYEKPTPQINNVCNLDLTVADEDPDPEPDPDPDPEPDPDPDPEPEGDYHFLHDHAVLAKTLVDGTVANVYDGLLYSEGGALAGTIQVKLAKANKSGVAKLSATITPMGGKKVTVSGNFDVTEHAFSADAKGGDTLDLVIGADGLYGSYGDYAIDGARNLYSSKDADDKEAVAASEAWIGAYALAWEESQADDALESDATGTSRLQGLCILSIVIAKKGQVKVAGTLADGTAVSTTATMLIGAERCCIPVVYSKKDVTLNFAIWFPVDANFCSRQNEDGSNSSGRDQKIASTGGSFDIVGLDGAIFGKAGNLDGDSTFSLDVESLVSRLSSSTTTVLADYLPDGAEIGVSGTKWVVMPDEKGKAAPAGKLVWDKAAGAVDEDKSKIDGYNVSGLKLTFTAKSGTFKGSFKVYTVVKNALKNVTVSVSGVVIDGVGYGTASVKNLGGVPVTIE